MNQKLLSTFLAVVACLFFSRNTQAAQIDVSKKPKPASTLEISDQAADLGFNVRQLKTIDRKVSALVNSNQVVGCSALIVKDDQEVFFGGWGSRDREKQLPIARDTIFRIYSMTKPITSIAVMQLVEQGKIDLDVPVSTYLPEFEDLKVLENVRDGKSKEVQPKRPMTTRDLLRHTSGLTYGFFGDTEIDKRYKQNAILVLDRNIEQTVSKLAKIPLLNHPGSKFVYSASTDVLGRLVEVVSEKPFDVYLYENIFQPLEMTDTFFSLPFEKRDRFAQLYTPGRSGLMPANQLQSVRFLSEMNEYFSGGGGLCSTLNDYGNFCSMLLNNGKFADQKIVKPETLDQMFTNQLDKIDNPPGQFKFGLGFAISKRGDFSWGGAAGTRFWVNPEKKLAILYMVQIMPYGNRKGRNLVRDAAYAALRD